VRREKITCEETACPCGDHGHLGTGHSVRVFTIFSRGVASYVQKAAQHSSAQVIKITRVVANP
jgi:hypothetical protein